MPKLNVNDWVSHAGGPNSIFGQNDGRYAICAPSKAAGLTQFGLHLERLPPQSRSSHRHWHENEDECIYLLTGEVVLIEDTETTLREGNAAAWTAGHPVAHCLENRPQSDAVLLVVGTR